MRIVFAIFWIFASTSFAEVVNIAFRTGHGFCETSEDGSTTECGWSISELKSAQLELKPNEWGCATSQKFPSQTTDDSIYGACMIEKIEVEGKIFYAFLSLSRYESDDQPYYDLSLQIGTDLWRGPAFESSVTSLESMPLLRLKSSNIEISSFREVFSHIQIERMFLN